MQYAVRRERNDNSKITNDNSNSMYLFTFYNSKVSLPSFRPRAHEPAHNSNADEVREFGTSARGGRKIKPKISPRQQREGFHQGRTYALC